MSLPNRRDFLRGSAGIGLLIAFGGCTSGRDRDPAPPRDLAPRSAASAPAGIDLRPRLLAWNLPPRSQGGRGTCSIFTTCAAIEFAHAVRAGTATRLSPEFLNWAAGEVAGRPSDGNFFHNALAGFEKHGVCAELSMPYRETFDPGRGPSADAVSEAARLRDDARGTLAVRWIVPWIPNRFDVSDGQFAGIRRVLAAGYPVAAGSSHSRLLVGCRDDPAAPGGGVFITVDSALNRFDEVSFEFVRKRVADAFWIEAVPRQNENRPAG